MSHSDWHVYGRERACSSSLVDASGGGGRNSGSGKKGQLGAECQSEYQYYQVQRSRLVLRRPNSFPFHHHPPPWTRTMTPRYPPSPAEDISFFKAIKLYVALIPVNALRLSSDLFRDVTDPQIFTINSWPLNKNQKSMDQLIGGWYLAQRKTSRSSC